MRPPLHPRIPMLRLLTPLLLAATSLAQISGPSASTAVRPQPIPVPLAQELPALQEQSAWAQDTKYEGATPDLRRRGAFVIGNGRAFGVLGLGARAAWIGGMVGPDYGALGGGTDEQKSFGAVTLVLRRNGTELPLSEQRVRRIRNAGIVATEDRETDGLALRMLAFAPPPAPARIVAVVDVVNTGTAPAAGLELAAIADGTLAPEGAALLERIDTQGHSHVARYELSGGKASGNGCLAALPALAPGASHRALLTITFGTPGGLEPATVDVASAQQLAQQTLQWWQQRLAGSFELDSDHFKLTDLVGDVKVATVCQRDERSGLVIPMLGRREATIRDSVGPLLTFLRANMWDDAKAILQWWFRSIGGGGTVPARLPLTFTPGSNKPDWNKLGVPASDLPLWVLLQHFWYWRTTHDAELIQAHWPLIEACLKRVPRAKDDLIPFDGSESVLHGTLLAQFPQPIGDGSMLIAESAAHDRRAWSFASGTMFLLAVQAVGEMVDGLDRKQHPEKWAGEGPARRPSQVYTERSFPIMNALEKRYWLDQEQHFAPAISMISDQPHRVPVANLNLFPLWIGWTFPTGERSRDNLRNSLSRLWRDGARIGTTPTCGYATGDVQAMLVTALCERDAIRRLEAFDAMLAMATPAGEWADLYAPDGLPVGGLPDGTGRGLARAHPHLLGVNLDAALYAVHGIRAIAVPNWDNNDIRAELRMPNGATFVTLKALKKDGRQLDIYMREIHEPLNKEELEANKEKKPEEQRDPNAEHRRLAFRMELVSGSPAKGYYDVGLNAMGTMFVRYLWPEGRVIDEREFWAPDKEAFLPADAPTAIAWPPLQAAADARTLVLTNRRAMAELVRGEAVTLVDTGAPWRIEDLLALLRTSDGAPAHAELLLDYGCQRAGPSTLKTAAFWQQGAFDEALRAFEAVGGKVLRTEFLTTAQDAQGQPRRAEDSSFRMRRGERLKFTVQAEAEAEHVLRTGSDCGLRVLVDGKEVFSREVGLLAMPDSDATLVRFTPGAHEITVEALGDGTVFIRLSDQKGMPARGLQ